MASRTRVLPLAALLALFPLALDAQSGSRTVQAGAPGTESRVVDPSQVELRFPLHVEADVTFMQMMIAHHAQALVLSSMVPERSAREDVQLLAHRIHLSQGDEIALMANWLLDRGEALPPEAEPWMKTPSAEADPHAGHGGHGGHAGHGAPPAADPHAGHDMGGMPSEGHDHSTMPGMLSDEQLAELEASSGEAFDRLFLEFMIYHHEGAILMVQELFASAAGGQEWEIYQFASHVDSDQRIEIERMRRMLATGN
jgi:uncharacterized protein (DUF305 family)